MFKTFHVEQIYNQKRKRTTKKNLYKNFPFQGEDILKDIMEAKTNVLFGKFLQIEDLGITHLKEIVEIEQTRLKTLTYHQMKIQL